LRIGARQHIIDAQMSLIPADPPPGPFRREFWRSPLRGPWLSSLLGSAMLPLFLLCIVTGYLSHAAYDPGLGHNAVSSGGIVPYFFHWPTDPAWLYAATQGIHIAAGIALAPVLLAKLWSVIPKLFEWPAVRSPAHAIERLSIALLVASSLFTLVSGLFNSEIFYPWRFSFVPVHYYAAILFTASLAFHVAVKFKVIRQAFRDRGVLAPLRESLAETEPEPPAHDTTAPTAPGPPTISRRGFVGTVGVASLAVGVSAAGQSIGGPLRELAIFAPRGRVPAAGPNGFQVNKTASAVGITTRETGPAWSLRVSGPDGRSRVLTRDQLLALPQGTQDLPIACVEGWSTTQRWTGVPLRALGELVGAGPGHLVGVQSLQQHGEFRQATLAANQADDGRSLLALHVNGVDLSLDHGFPARIIVPALPGVHCTKWVSSLEFTAA
jgi:DMSO/TMAO reductase YedYZ molybdopterin-dependent catalytic subunit